MNLRPRRIGTSTAKHRWMLAAKLAIAALVAVFIARSFSSAQAALAQTPSFSLQSISKRWLAAAGVSYLLAMLPMAIYWQLLNGAFGQTAGFWTTFRAYTIGHLGKYVPGKAMVVVLRTAFLRGEQTTRSVIATTVFIETFTMMAVGAALAAALIGWQFAEHKYLLGLAFLLTLAAGIPTWPPLLRFGFRSLKKTQLTQEIQAGLAGYGWRTMLTGWALELVGWLLVGFSLWCVLCALPRESLGLSLSLSEVWPRLTASASLSMVAGFLSLLPGGLGVREAVLDQLLKQPFGPIVAFVAPILLRLVWLMTELAVSGILYVSVYFADDR